eukprot:TRINITY_DN7284_c2_g1_i1.p2 TRINITY_DN7284_c2_g1~~TRINITY_DN7284_c2_g1_i1.p2  ORF type:complete len:339 (-),score=67.52 TRINITY_DN7284_c2_g1_i1:193-1209(-)
MASTPVDPAPPAQPNTNGNFEIYDKLKSREAVVFYEKPLTSSDSNGAGRVVIPKQVAHAHFPLFQDHTPQVLQAEDTEGAHYDLRFRFWVNGSSRMYLLEGLGELHRKFMLRTGDVMIFARAGDGSLLLAGRPGTKDDIIKKVPRQGRGETRAREASENLLDHRRESAKKKVRHSAFHGVMLFPDGVFRQVNSTFPPEIVANHIVEHNGLHFAGIDVDGEVYAAVFANRDDAMEAFVAAGCGELVTEGEDVKININNNLNNVNNVVGDAVMEDIQLQQQQQIQGQPQIQEVQQQQQALQTQQLQQQQVQQQQQASMEQLLNMPQMQQQQQTQVEMQEI